MKNINSKSFKQYQVNSNKRAISPLLTSHHPGLESNSNPKSGKKKIIGTSPYQKAVKQFQTYGKGDRKKTSNYIDSEGKQQHNKFRIVTEPVDDRILHLAQSNLFNTSLAIKQSKKIQTELIQSSAQIRLNLRQPANSQSRSRDRIYSKPKPDRNIVEPTDESGEKSEGRNKSRELTYGAKCKNCLKFTEELQYLNAQIKKIVKTKQLWQRGEITTEEAREVYNSNKQCMARQVEGKLRDDHNSISKVVENDKTIKANTYSHNSLQNLNKHIEQKNMYKFADAIVNQVKYSISDLISEIEALTFIDYPKMLQMQIFKYEPTYQELIDTQQTELKQLFAQLRTSVEGKIIEYDTYDTESENNYVKLIMKNLKSRLSGSLRQNLELRICKSIYEKSQQISEESEQYLRKVIEDVLQNYICKPHSQKQKQSNREKQKHRASKK